MKEKIDLLIDELNQVILGNEKQIILAVICLLAKGHLLIEDLPGTGKSTLSKTLAKCFGLSSKSVHFTSDLLPSDITGINIFDSVKSSFKFEAGPIFSNFFLADEINRASPRTQSALLEAMNNKEISFDHVVGTTLCGETVKKIIEQNNFNIKYLVKNWLFDHLYLWGTLKVTREQHKRDNIIRNNHTLLEKLNLNHYKNINLDDLIKQ